MKHTSVHAAFAEQCDRVPDALAVSCGATRLTYRELDRRANRLAHRLLDAGAEPGARVAVLLERSADVVVALLAVLKAGACYVPLNSASPPDHLNRVLARLDRPVLLTDAATRARGLPDAGHAVDVDRGLDGYPSEAPPDPGESDGERPAWIMFTSGSTGQPKGVCLPHRAVLSFALDQCWAGHSHERVLSVAPYAFGVSAYELWAPLLHGHHTVIAPPGDLGIPLLRRLLQDEDITAVHLTAGLFRVVAEEAPELFASVAEVLTGGDAIAPVAVRRVLERCPGTVVRACYGATEVTAFATTAAMTTLAQVTSPVPVGRPLDGVHCHILDDTLTPVGPGEEGELYLAGDRVATGYLDDPEETRKRFVPGPDGARMFRTGDLATVNPAGLLEIRGRIGDQVKIRGNRVEPGEVESVLAEHPGVAHVAVVARDAGDGEKRLVAYIVPAPGRAATDLGDHAAAKLPADAVPAPGRDGADLGDHAAAKFLADVVSAPGRDGADLSDYAAAKLPAYAVPAAYVTLDALPLTPNGKLDRAALPEPDPDRRAPFRPPGTARQRLLCALFAEVLGHERVGLDDSFFDLDGQSLQAVKLAGRIETELGVEMKVADLFDAPTVAELDDRLGAEGGTRP